MKKRADLIDDIVDNLAALKRALMIRGHETVRSANVTPSQVVVLKIVHHHPGIGAQGIARHMGMTTSAATQLIDPLLENGLLIRKQNTDDRRVWELQLSDKSREAMAQLKKEGVDRIKCIFEGLSDEELVTYAELSRKIAETIINKKECGGV